MKNDWIVELYIQEKFSVNEKSKKENILDDNEEFFFTPEKIYNQPNYII